MFCSNCGTMLPNGVKFCSNCGANIAGGAVYNNGRMTAESRTMPMPSVSFVPAKCTNCGAALQVDPSQEAAICRFCNTPFLVEKAINNYNISVSGNLQVASATINVQGANADNLIRRAKEFEARRELRNALDYYERVLDIDVGNHEAVMGSARVKEAIQNYVYLESDANLTMAFGKLQLKKGALFFKSNNGKKDLWYALNGISELKVSFFTVISFKYTGKFMEQSINVKGISAAKWVAAIKDAQRGIYPQENI